MVMNQDMLPEDLRRFILTIPSIPYLEAILLFRNEPNQPWETETVGRRLYMPEEQAEDIIKTLCAAHICAPLPDRPNQYQYQPESESLANLINCLATFYAKNLIEVTNMIHGQSSKNHRVRQFAEAFRWRKEK